MQNYTDEMARIGGDLCRARQARAQSRSEIRGETRGLLGETRMRMARFASERRLMAFTQARSLRQEAVQRIRKIGAFRRKARKNPSLHEALAKIQRDVSRIRKDTAQFIKGLRQDRAEHSHKTKSGLVKYAANLEKEVHSRLQDGRAGLQEFAADFKKGGQVLRSSLSGQSANSKTVKGKKK